MSHPLFTKHEATLQKSPRRHRDPRLLESVLRNAESQSDGETANADGEAAFKAHLNKTFEVDQPTTGETVGAEQSPFGFPLGIRYPKSDPEALIASAASAQRAWREAGPEAWIGVSLEILARINRASFENRLRASCTPPARHS